uniref:Uncharacterized protein n=1 Tax=Torrey Pines virus TaxID=1654361 RepID=A0A2Z4QKY4_9REOV|nr:hypothetical protein [Torrey Pines virus]
MEEISQPDSGFVSLILDKCFISIDSRQLTYAELFNCIQFIDELPHADVSRTANEDIVGSAEGDMPLTRVHVRSAVIFPTLMNFTTSPNPTQIRVLRRLINRPDVYFTKLGFVSYVAPAVPSSPAFVYYNKISSSHFGKYFQTLTDFSYSVSSLHISQIFRNNLFLLRPGTLNQKTLKQFTVRLTIKDIDVQSLCTQVAQWPWECILLDIASLPKKFNTPAAYYNKYSKILFWLAFLPHVNSLGNITFTKAVTDAHDSRILTYTYDFKDISTGIRNSSRGNLYVQNPIDQYYYSAFFLLHLHHRFLLPPTDDTADALAQSSSINSNVAHEHPRQKRQVPALDLSALGAAYYASANADRGSTPSAPPAPSDDQPSSSQRSATQRVRPTVHQLVKSPVRNISPMASTFESAVIQKLSAVDQDDAGRH